jgi:hypothetical protein
MKEYFNYNPIARKIFEAEANKSGDQNIKILKDFISVISACSFDVFKMVCFDLGSSVERNPDNLSVTTGKYRKNRRRPPEP